MNVTALRFDPDWQKPTKQIVTLLRRRLRINLKDASSTYLMNKIPRFNRTSSFQHKKWDASSC
jgi:hypothetical protein